MVIQKFLIHFEELERILRKHLLFFFVGVSVAFFNQLSRDVLAD